MKWQTDPYRARRRKSKKKNKREIYIKQTAQYFGFKTNLLQGLK